jgi:hypothetical protein
VFRCCGRLVWWTCSGGHLPGISIKTAAQLETWFAIDGIGVQILGRLSSLHLHTLSPPAPTLLHLTHCCIILVLGMIKSGSEALGHLSPSEEGSHSQCGLNTRTSIQTNKYTFTLSSKVQCTFSLSQCVKLKLNFRAVQVKHSSL